MKSGFSGSTTKVSLYKGKTTGKAKFGSGMSAWNWVCSETQKEVCHTQRQSEEGQRTAGKTS